MLLLKYIVEFLSLKLACILQKFAIFEITIINKKSNTIFIKSILVIVGLIKACMEERRFKRTIIKVIKIIKIILIIDTLFLKN